MRLNPVSLFFCLLLACFFITVSAEAQQENKIRSSSKSKDGRFRFLQFQSVQSGGIRVDTSVANIKKLLNLGSRHSLIAQRLSRGSTDEKLGSNIFHKKFLQYFNGVKVEFGVLNTVSKAASLEAIAGEYFPVDDNFSTSPILSEQVALQRAMDFFRAEKYSWEDPLNSPQQAQRKPKGELVICKDFMQQSKAEPAPQMHLAYKFALYATQPLRYDYVYIDAVNGNVLLDNPIIKHVDGIAATRYSGTRTIATTGGTSGNFVLRDSGDQYRAATYNLNRGTNYSTAPLFSDNDNNWSAAEFDDSNYDNAALDAHWGAMMTLDYWRTVHGRNSFDDNGAMIRSYVHYSTSYANAFWDGVEMTYGDGDGVSFFPFTSIDICGHEIGHGVCQYTANLIYSGESGALNESFSDIWGACIKRFAAPEKNTWLTADEVSGTGTPLRSMMNPKMYGQPDTYHGSFWYDDADVHVNSGVQNFWFYILTEGKSGTNDLGYTYYVNGIGITEAARIAYRAESVYLFPSATYADARIASIRAAEDLYGANSNEVNQTTEAWNAVGVYDVIATPSNLAGILVNGNQIKLNWSYSPLQTVSGFAIERAVDQGDFAQIAVVDSSLKQFIDSNVVNDSINSYRIRAIRNGNYSGYSNAVAVSVGQSAYVMTTGNKIGCNYTLLDPGGYNLYDNSTNTFTTLTPAIPGQKVRVTFSKFRTESGSDVLYVYNGPNSASPLIGQFSGNSLPPPLESTAPGGELRFEFHSNGQVQDSGWVANVSCSVPLFQPTNLVATVSNDQYVNLSWIDNSVNETGYVVQRSMNNASQFSTIGALPANSNHFTDTVNSSSQVYYRVFAIRDAIMSPPSSSVTVGVGNLLLMQNGTYQVCNKIFMDPAGYSVYDNGSNYTSTLKPIVSTSKIKIQFTQFRLESCCDHLWIYNGPSTSSPLVGTFSGTSLPPSIESTSPNGELTFVFSSDASIADSGWIANVTCTPYDEMPGSFTGSALNERSIKLQWSFSSAFPISGFYVERSLGDSLHFRILDSVATDQRNYTDTTPIINSKNYYRVRAIFTDRLSSPSLAIGVNTLNCFPAPLFLASKNKTTAYILVQPNTALSDDSCKWFANVHPIGLDSVSGHLRGTLWVDSTSPRALGMNFVPRHFDILPDSNYLHATGFISLYFTQAEFDAYNAATNHSRLPVNGSDNVGMSNLKVYVFPGVNPAGDGWPGHYQNLPMELDTANYDVLWDPGHQLWIIYANVTGFGGFFISSNSDTTFTCSSNSEASVQFKSNIYGSFYQWQKFNGTTFVDITDNAIYSGTSTALLDAKMDGLINGDKFRCIVNESMSRTFVLIKGNRWNGSVNSDWFNPQNWSCGAAPSASSDVLIEAGKLHYPLITSDITVRSITVATGGRVEVAPGVKVNISH